jgi:DNA-binding NtrC family response regulator
MVMPLAETGLKTDSPPNRTAFPGAEDCLLLVVDDMEEVRRLVGNTLAREGYEIKTFGSGEACLDAMAVMIPDAIYLDVDMPGLSGLQTLERIREKHPRVPVIMLTGDDSVESVVAAMKLGAYDYLVKPPERQKLVTVARNAVEHYRMSVQLTSLKRETGGSEGFRGIVTRAESMKEVFRQMDRVAPTAITLLIRGESGTGKELVARAIHDHSPRKRGPFVALNCAAIPDTLQESELFGHEKGSFTGATGKRLGRFELADKGTLFLDEVAELSLPLQAKLLRVLQDSTFQRVGGSQDIRSDFRLVTATHKDLAREVREGRFREDLYFRIVVFELELPPLRERHGDLDLLVNHFLRQYEGERERPIEVSAQAASLLSAYPWPGNVRELENAIQRAVVAAEHRIEPEHLPSRLREEALTGAQPAAGGSSSPPTPRTGSFDTEELNLERLERRAIERALGKTRGNLAEAGRLLGLSRATLYRKLKTYKLRPAPASRGETSSSSPE